MRKILGLPETKLQALRIPNGWTVEHNSLREINPKYLHKDDEKWLYFTQDLLRFCHQKKLYTS